MSVLPHFLSGVALILMPCSAFIIPVVLLKFTVDKKVSLTKLLWFALTFWSSFAILGIFIYFLGNNPISTAIKIVLSLFFISIGVVAMFVPLKLQFAFNSKLSDAFLGFLVPLVIIFSPCGIPVVSLNVATGFNFIAILAMGIGALVPFLVLAFVGSLGNKILQKIIKATYYIEKTSGLLLVIAGVYGLYSLGTFNKFDFILSIFLALGGLILFFFWTLRKRKYKLQRIVDSMMFMVSLIVWVFIWNYCNNKITVSVAHICGQKIHCSYCASCYVLFIVGAVITAGLYLLASMLVRKKPLRSGKAF